MLALVLVGCSDDGSAGVGDELPELRWEGYVNETGDGISSEQPFRAYSSRDLDVSGRRYALIHLAADF